MPEAPAGRQKRAPGMRFSARRGPSGRTFLRFIHLKAHQTDKFPSSEKHSAIPSLWVSATIPAFARGKCSICKYLTEKALYHIETMSPLGRPHASSQKARRLQQSDGCRQAITGSPATCPHVIHNDFNSKTPSQRLTSIWPAHVVRRGDCGFGETTQSAIRDPQSEI